MEDLQSGLEAIQISAFTKLKQISPYVHNVTLGPGSVKENQDKTEVVVKSPKEKSNEIEKSVHYHNNFAPFDKILSEYEMQRKRKVQDAINSRKLEISNFSTKQCAKKNIAWVEKQEKMILQNQQQESEILKALEQIDKDSNLKHEKLISYYEALAERRRKNDQAIQEKAEYHRKIHKIIDNVLKTQQEFSSVYLDIIQILKNTDANCKSLLTPQIENLRNMPKEMDNVVVKIKTGNDIVEQDATKCRELLDCTKTLRDNIKQIIVLYLQKYDEIIEAQSANRANEKTQLHEHQSEVPVQYGIKETNPQSQSNTNTPKNEGKQTLDSFVSKNSFKTYSELQLFLKNHESSFMNLLHDASAKDFRFDCKKAVNIPVNAISDTSSNHLLDKYLKLHNLLAGKVVQISDKQILASRHPEGINYSMHLLSKKFIFQGDLLLSGNQGDRPGAFSYAAIIVALWNDFADFGRLILAEFHKQCPYLVPIYLPRLVDQTDEDYYVSVGYQYKDGTVEEQNKFLKRMTGIMRLYCAILITKPKQGQNHHPHNLTYGWRWLAAILNMEPRTDITATLIFVFLEVCGSSMMATYGIQFKKLLDFLCNSYMPLLKKNNTSGPVSRLEELLQNFIKHGYFESPKGMLPAYFW